MNAAPKGTKRKKVGFLVPHTEVVGAVLGAGVGSVMLGEAVVVRGTRQMHAML